MDTELGFTAWPAQFVVHLCALQENGWLTGLDRQLPATINTSLSAIQFQIYVGSRLKRRA